jgi:hypothetical protein
MQKLQPQQMIGCVSLTSVRLLRDQRDFILQPEDVLAHGTLESHLRPVHAHYNPCHVLPVVALAIIRITHLPCQCD